MDPVIDAKPTTEAASSAASDATGAPSAQTTQTSQPSGLATALQGVMDKHLATDAKEETSTTEPKAGDDNVEESETEATKEEPTTEEEGEDETSQADDKGPIPYSRFQEVNEAKNKAEAQVESWKGYVQAQESIQAFCQKYDIAPKEFGEWFDTLAAIKTDPARASQLLQPYLQQVQAETGSVLPKDLQDAVDAGELKLDLAKELAQSRAKLKLTERRSQDLQRQTQTQRQQELERSYHSTLSNWYTSRIKTDPDFVPAKDGKDGKYEFWLAKLQTELGTLAARNEFSVEGIAKAADKAYDSVSTFAKRFLPRTNGSTKLRTGQSGTAPVAAPKTLKEALIGVAKRHGVSV